MKTKLALVILAMSGSAFAQTAPAIQTFTPAQATQVLAAVNLSLQQQDKTIECYYPSQDDMNASPEVSLYSLPDSPSSVTENGSIFTFEYDSAAKTMTYVVTASADQKSVLSVQIKETDAPIVHTVDKGTFGNPNFSIYTTPAAPVADVLCQ